MYAFRDTSTYHFKKIWTGNAAQSDEYIYFDDYGEIAETGYSAD